VQKLFFNVLTVFGNCCSLAQFLCFVLDMCVWVNFKRYFVCPDSECIRVFLVYKLTWLGNPKQVHGIFFRILRGYCVVVNFSVKCATNGMKSS